MCHQVRSIHRIIFAAAVLFPVQTIADPGLPLASLDQRNAATSQISSFDASNIQAAPLEKPGAESNSRHGSSKSVEAPGSELPSYRQDLGQLKSLSNANTFHVQAALAVQNRIKSRDMTLIEYRFSDTNDDTSQEVVALSGYTDSQGQYYYVLSIYDFDEALEPILRYEKKQLTAEGRQNNAHMRQYKQQIEPADPGFSLCEDWVIASWSIHECHLIQLDKSWQPRVIAHEIETAEPGAHSSQRNAYNFKTRLASRAYTRLPAGTFMPALSRESGYAMIFASRDASLSPGPVALNTAQSASFSEHADIQYASRWNDAGIYFSFEFQDSDASYPEVCSENISIQQADHAEFWFDLNPGLSIDREHPESWLLEYEKNYQSEPYRHHLDGDIYGLAVMPNGCVMPMTPIRERWQVMPQVSTKPTSNGYRMDIFIPAAFYGVEKLSELHRSLGLGFTARQHDIHGDYRFSSASTSDFHWPDPFTFGQIWLLPEGAAYPPHYPLQWSKWLE